VKKLFGVLLVVALVLSFSLVATTPVAAQTDRLVPGQYGTIQEAINAAAPGDTILVEPNTYEEQLTITTDGLTIKPAGPGEVIVKLPDSSLLDTLAAPSPVHNLSWIIRVHDAENVTIEGLTVDGGDGLPETVNGTTPVHLRGIWYEDASGTIEDNTIKNIRRSEPGTAGNWFSYSAVIAVRDASDDTAIRGNTVLLHEHGREGISLIGAHVDATVTIEGNQVFGVGDDMVHNWMHSGIAVVDVAGRVDILNNTVDDVWSEKANSQGIFLVAQTVGSSGDIAVLYNTVSGSNSGIWVWEAAADILSVLTISWNSIAGNGWGFINQSSIVVDATLNWWGDASGPYHNPGNLGGKGDPIWGDVVFMPWLMEEGGPDLTETNTGFDEDAKAETANVSADATGGGATTTVTVGEYADNPTAVDPGFVVNDVFFFDVHAGGELPDELVVEVKCPGADCNGMVLRWFDGAEWLDVTPAAVDDNGVLRFTLDDESSPTIAELTGTPFGLGNPTPPPPPPVTVGWEGSAVNRAAVVAPWIALFALMAGASLLVVRRRGARI